MIFSDQRLKKGSVLGPYKITRLIGKGGMGEVYEAYDEVLNRHVALKVISPKHSGDQGIVKRFMSEGQALARLNHQNVVVVYTLGEEKGIHYIAMEFVDGKSLDQFVKSRVMTADEAVPYFAQMLDGVKALHGSGIIHRDLKPKNIIIRNDNSVKIVDFGIAKVDEAQEMELTSTGMLIGSIYYLAPEIARGKPASVQSDIWSLGVIFYELLVGHNPFVAENHLAILDKIKTEELRFPLGSKVSISEDLRRIILKMCEKSPSHRYRNIEAVQADLDLFLKNKPVLRNDPKFKNRRIVNEGEVRKQIEDAGFSETEVKSIMSSASEIQDQWSDERDHTLILDKSTLQTRISQPALKQAISNVRGPATAVRSSTAHRRSTTHKEPGSSFNPTWLAFVLVMALGGWWFWNNQKAEIAGEVEEPPSPDIPPQVEPVPERLSLSTPANGEEVWLDTNGRVRFAFRGDTQRNMKLQVAVDRDFSNLIVDKRNPSSPFRAGGIIEDNLYYWRLVSESGSELTEPANFFVIIKKPPRLVFPRANFSLYVGQSLEFQWEEKLGVDAYRFQIAKDSKFARPLQNRVVYQPMIGELTLPKGDYYWRVRAENNSYISRLWSESRFLRVVPLPQKAPPPAQKIVARPKPKPRPKPRKTIRPKPKPPAVTLGVPGLTNTRISTVLRFKPGTSRRNPAQIRINILNPPQLGWRRVRGASTYELQISKLANFRTLEWDEVIRGTRTSWQPVGPGVFYWRVRAVNRRGSRGKFSRTGRINVSLPPPVLPASISRNLNVRSPAELSKGTPVTLNWAEVPFATFYKVVVAKNRRFSPAFLEFNTDKESAALRLKDEGKYYVRVAPLNEAGKLAGAFSNITLLNFAKQLRIGVPTVRVPPNGIQVVSFSGKQNPIVFKWNKVEYANSYRIEFSRDRRFRRVLHSTTARENQAIVTKTFPKGKVFWRMRAERGASYSDWTSTYFFELP